MHIIYYLMKFIHEFLHQLTPLERIPTMCSVGLAAQSQCEQTLVFVINGRQYLVVCYL